VNFSRKKTKKSFGFYSVFLPFFFHLSLGFMFEKGKEIYEFGEFRLDITEHLLLRISGKRIPLSEKAFKTLCILVRNSGHLVYKDEILNEVWKDSFVEENNLSKCIHAIRQALEEKSSEQKFIETVRKYGYRFIADVRQIENMGIEQRKPFASEENQISSSKISSFNEKIPAQNINQIFSLLDKSRGDTDLSGKDRETVIAASYPEAAENSFKKDFFGENLRANPGNSGKNTSATNLRILILTGIFIFMLALGYYFLPAG
jgi:DNA-binding winged helix-turn-helix (wHTH) protein